MSPDGRVVRTAEGWEVSWQHPAYPLLRLETVVFGALFFEVVGLLVFSTLGNPAFGVWNAPAYVALVVFGLAWTAWARRHRVTLRWTETHVELPVGRVPWSDVRSIEHTPAGLWFSLPTTGCVVAAPRDRDVATEIVRRFRLGRPVPAPGGTLFDVDEGSLSRRTLEVRVEGETSQRWRGLDGVVGLSAVPMTVMFGVFKLPSVRASEWLWGVVMVLLTASMLLSTLARQLSKPRWGRIDLDANRVVVTNGWGRVLADVLWDDIEEVRPDETRVVLVCVSGDVVIGLLGETPERAWAVGEAIREARPAMGEPVTPEDRGRLRQLLAGREPC